MKLLPYGPHAVLAEFEDLHEVMTTAAAWRANDWLGVVEIVPAARTVLVVHDGRLDTSLLQPATAERRAVDAPTVTLHVRYDGEDLAAVAAATGLPADDVIALHSGATYTVAFCGFMPGFAYLVGLPEPLVLPRRATPRTRVAAGSVAIASEFSAVYPCDSPGGWHLLGTTAATLWDDAREPPALLTPGTTVRFTPQ